MHPIMREALLQAREQEIARRLRYAHLQAPRPPRRRLSLQVALPARTARRALQVVRLALVR